MKKILFTILAALCLAACSQVNIDVNQNQEEITFETAFTAYATRTDNSGIGFDEFYVWGYQTDSKNNTICIFNGTPVTFSEGRWDYDKNYSEDEVKGTRYWIPNCTYRFYAFAPEIDPMITISNTASNQPPQIDIMSWGMLPQNEYMYATYNSSETTSSDGSVVLTFNHVLSKVSMSFTNDIHQYIKATVSNINLKIPQSGSVNINIDNITTSTANSQIYTFKLKPENYYDPEILEVVELLPNNNNTGETSSILLFPNESNFDYEVRFDVTLAVHNDVPETYSNETVTPGTTTITGKLTKKLEIGKAYKFSTILTPEVIKSGTTDIYAEEIEGWNNANGEQQISIASKLGGTVTLTEDLTLSDSFNVLDDLTINLNGKTLTYTGNTQLFNVIGTGSLTINGEVDGSAISSNKIIATAAEAGSNIIINGGSHTTAGSSAYITTGGSISVTDGSFKSAPVIVGTSQTYKTLHIEDDNAGTITVSGGSFYMWDPSNGDTDFDDPKNFLARPAQDSNEKLTIKYKEDWFLVRKEVTIYGDKNQASSDFIDTVKNKIEDGDVINLETDITVPNLNDFRIQNKGNVTINMNNNTLAGDASSGYAGLILSNTNITINNGNFTGGGLNIQGEGSKATLNNCNITITSVNTSGRHGIYAGTKAEVIFNGGTITFAPSDNAAKKRSYFCADGGTIYVLDCKCGVPSTRTETPPLYLVNGGNVIIYRGTFGFNPEQYVTLPEGSTSTKSGNQWIVTSTYIDISDDGITSIHGGTYAFDPNPWTADGYEAVQNDDGTWTVQPIAATGN